MSENEFNWNFDEAETNERLVALENTRLTLTELIMESNVVTGEYPLEMAKTRMALTGLQEDLMSYAKDNNYDLSPALDAFNKSVAKEDQNPFKEEYDRINGFVVKSQNVEIDESQFEVPDQNQKTL